MPARRVRIRKGSPEGALEVLVLAASLKAPWSKSELRRVVGAADLGMNHVNSFVTWALQHGLLQKMTEQEGWPTYLVDEVKVRRYFKSQADKAGRELPALLAG